MYLRAFKAAIATFDDAADSYHVRITTRGGETLIGAPYAPFNDGYCVRVDIFEGDGSAATPVFVDIDAIDTITLERI